MTFKITAHLIFSFNLLYSSLFGQCIDMLRLRMTKQQGEVYSGRRRLLLDTNKYPAPPLLSAECFETFTHNL